MKELNLMMLNEEIPLYLGISFIVITVVVYVVLNLAMKRTLKPIKAISMFLVVWLGLQAILALKGFYLDFDSTIPKIPFLVVPAFILIAITFITKSGRDFIDKLPLNYLTYLHVIRIPVELVLYGLYLESQIPIIMTFEGRNFDILAGLSAPIIAYFYFNKKLVSSKVLLIWNFCALGLLLNIVIIAVLSLPLPFQQYGFEQPNVAVPKFPIVWLPAFVVPVVLFFHLVSIRRLLKK